MGGGGSVSNTTITEPFYGLYRGIVLSNVDPEALGRITATVPQVFGDNETPSNWAWPCVPPGSSTLPSPNTGVWIAFEGGDVDHPIWLGVWKLAS